MTSTQVFLLLNIVNKKRDSHLVLSNPVLSICKMLPNWYFLNVPQHYIFR